MEPTTHKAKKGIENASFAREEGTEDPTEPIKTTIGDRLREGGRDLLTDEKQRLVKHIRCYQSAVLDASSKLREDDHLVLARQLESAAASVGNVEQYLDERTSEELLEEAGRVFREHPAACFTGSFLAGLAIARFLKARPRIDDAKGETGIEERNAAE